jgi:DNA-binding SARP family transcriptional activator
VLRVFGTPHIEGDKGSKLPAKAFALVAMLRLDFQNVADRSVIAARLWESLPDPGANLRMLLSQLRRWQQSSGIVLLKWSARRIWRDDDCAAMDLDRFMVARSMEASFGPGELADLYGGEFLLGLDFSSDPELSAWTHMQRQHLKDRLIIAGLGAANAAIGPEAIRLLQVLGHQAPLDEAVERSLLTHLAAGRFNAARDEYAAFRVRLRAELDCEPALETRALARQLGLTVAEDTPIHPALAAAPAPAAPAPAVPPSGLPRVLLLPPELGPLPFPRGLTLLAMSLIDDVTFSLCRLRSFAVIAPHTARQLARSESKLSPQAVGADYVLSTRLLPGHRPGQYRLGLSLTRESTQEVLLGDALPFSQNDLGPRHADLAAAIVERVAALIERSELKAFRRTGEASSYVHYLLGQERMRVIELTDLRKARKAFRRATDLMPTFAPAISAQARTLNFEWLLLGRSDREPLLEAVRLARQAIEVDSLEASGYRELGHALIYLRDLDEGLVRYEEALSRAPHHADILMNAADAMVHNSRHGDARDLMDLALSLNPLPPDDYLWIDAAVHFFQHRPESALRSIHRARNPEPMMRLAAACAADAGDLASAFKYRDRIMARQPDFRLDDWKKLIPVKDPLDQDKFVDALRKAGFQ